ncbi:hypothetical protein SUGI_0998430 [Cryptomeria japonica]|nr:hypothetical protein SUGI_0998430 [Cryptomeria japonica]
MGEDKCVLDSDVLSSMVSPQERQQGFEKRTPFLFEVNYVQGSNLLAVVLQGGLIGSVVERPGEKAKRHGRRCKRKEFEIFGCDLDKDATKRPHPQCEMITAGSRDVLDYLPRDDHCFDKSSRCLLREYTIHLHKHLRGCTFKKKAPKVVKDIKKFF